jgi:hypothetical protein
MEDKPETFIVLDDFLKTKKIKYNGLIQNTNEINAFDEENKKVDIIAFDKVFTLCVNNVAMFKKDYEGRLYYDFYPERECDIIDNIFCHSYKKVDVKFIIGGIFYSKEEFKEFIFVCSPYHEFRIRITFLDSLTQSDEIQIHYRGYWINDLASRRELAMKHVKTKFLTYRSGMSYRNI